MNNSFLIHRFVTATLKVSDPEKQQSHLVDAEELLHSLNPDQTDDDEKEVLVEINPERPSHIINAVKKSLDYWHRTVDLFANLEAGKGLQLREGIGATDWNSRMRVALIEQVGIWQSLLTGRQNLRSYRFERVTMKILRDINVEIKSRFSKDFRGGLHDAQAAIKQMGKDFGDTVDAVGTVAKEGLNAVYDQIKRYFWPVIAVLGVVVVAIFLMALFGNSSTAPLSLSGGTGVLGLLAAIFGHSKLQDIKNKKEEEIKDKQEKAKDEIEKKANSNIPAASTASSNEGGSGVVDGLKGALQTTGAAVFDAFERAYKQVHIELSGIKFGAAVSYPLIESFITTYDVKGDGQFIEEVICNKADMKEDIERIIGAAFGPVSIFFSLAGDQDGSERVDTTTL